MDKDHGVGPLTPKQGSVTSQAHICTQPATAFLLRIFLSIAECVVTSVRRCPKLCSTKSKFYHLLVPLYLLQFSQFQANNNIFLSLHPLKWFSNTQPALTHPPTPVLAGTKIARVRGGCLFMTIPTHPE